MMFSPRSLVLCLAWVLWCASTAVAQDALGDGRALDANLQVGSGGVNPQQPTPDFRARNDVITGNVPGLGYFHDEVGYTAPNEFRGRLSGDDLFRFRAQSLSSGLVPSSAGGYSSGLAQEQIRVYRALSGVNTNALKPDYSYGISVQGRAGLYDTSGLVVQTPRGGSAISPGLGAPATWSGLNHTESYERRIGVVQQPDGKLLEFSMSPLLGMRRHESQPATDFQTETGSEGVEPAADSRAITPDQPVLGLIDAVRLDQTAEVPSRLVGQIEASIFAPLQTTQPKPGQETYLELLEKIKERSRTVEPPSTETDVTSDDGQEAPQDDDNTSQQPPQPDTEQRGTNPSLERLLETLNYNLPDLTTLAGTQKNYANRLAHQAQDKLRDKRYLDAEGLYRQLLRFGPDNPMARVGLIHSQIGAGLLRSACFNLKALLQQHPELIATRYEATLLPDENRINWARNELMRMVELTPHPEPSLLLAYIAYHSKGSHLIGYALDLADERGLDRGLLAILRRVWLDESKSGTATENPAATQPATDP